MKQVKPDHNSLLPVLVMRSMCTVSHVLPKRKRIRKKRHLSMADRLTQASETPFLAECRGAPPVPYDTLKEVAQRII